MLGGKFTKKVKVGGRVKLAGTQRLDRFGVAGGCHSTFPEVTRRHHGQLTRVGPARAPVHPQTYSVALRWRECSSKKGFDPKDGTRAQHLEKTFISKHKVNEGLHGNVFVEMHERPGTVLLCLCSL